MKKNIIGWIIGCSLVAVCAATSFQAKAEGVDKVKGLSSIEKIDTMHNFLEAVELEIESGEPESARVATEILDELYEFFAVTLPDNTIRRLLTEQPKC